MTTTSSLSSGVAGACALTLVHEVLQRSNPEAPRMDLLGMNALAKLLHKVDLPVPKRDKLYALTMAGDLVSNALYYSLAGIGAKNGVLLRGTILGLAAGIGAVVLPKHLGLNNAPSNRTSGTKIMTVGIYLFGGLIAAGLMRLRDRSGN